MPQRSSVVLLILIDGLRHDYVNEKTSPFLYNLALRNVTGKIRETFAFQLRPAFFAGLYPEACDVAHMYMYDPANSPFAAGIDQGVTTYQELDRIARKIEAERGHTASSIYSYSPEIPLNLLRYFTLSEKYDIQDPGSLGQHGTLFDKLRQADKKWLWIAYPTHDQTTTAICQVFNSKIDQEDYAFIYLHFAEVDWAGHEYGPGSTQQQAALSQVDTAIRDIYSAVNRRYANVKSLVFGDHGMVAIKNTVDIEERLKNLPLKLEQDYVYFLDSTQARFWFRNELARQVITEMLEGMPDGQTLTDDDLSRLHFRFPHNKFGDLIWVAGDSRVIFPNFFQRNKPPVGMHGYLPEVVDNWAAFILTGVERNISLPDPLDLVEVYPALLEMLELTDVSLSASLADSELAQMAATSASPLDLSIVIPTYNRAERLKNCLFHLQDQSHPHQRFEIVIVDDGSQDSTATIVADFAKQADIPTRYCYQENRGPAAARNQGILAARGKIILFLGDDTYANVHLVEAHLQAHSRWPEIGAAIVGHVEVIPERAMFPFEMWNHRAGAQFAFDLIENADNLNFNFFYTSNASVKARMLRTHGLFDENFESALFEDTELACRLQSQGLLLKYSSEAVVHHDHPTDLSIFVDRQHKAGQIAVRLWEKFPSTRILVTPNWCNPLLLVSQEEIQKLVQWAEKTNAALAAEQIPAADRARKTDDLLDLSRLILDRYYALGFLEAIKLSNARVTHPDELPPQIVFSIKESKRLHEDQKWLGETLVRVIEERDELLPFKPKYEQLMFERGRVFVRAGRWVQDLSDKIILALPRPVRNTYFKLRGLPAPGN